MKFSLDSASLQHSLQQLGKVIPSRSTLPILSSVLISAENGRLSLRATDLEITQMVHIPSNVETEGRIAVPHRTLLEITNEMPDGEIEFSVDSDRRVKLTTTYGNYSIMGKPAEEFPSLPELDDQQSVEVPADLLKRVIDKTVFAVSKDDLKPSLMGVFFQFQENNFRAVSTDGHRLVKFMRKDFNKSNYIGEHIIPVKFLNILGSYLSDEDHVTLNIGDNFIMLNTPTTTIYSRIIAERYPDYESVFPNDNDKTLVVNRDELLSTVRRVSVFSNKTTHQIAFHLNADNVTITTEDVETVSSAQEKLPAEYKGDDLILGYNSNYLRDIISHIDCDQIQAEFKSAVSAAIYYPTEQHENEEMIMLLMPIRLND